MMFDILIGAFKTSWRTTAVGLGSAVALLLARRGLRVSEVELGTVIEAAGIAAIGLLAKDSVHSGSASGRR